MLTWVLLLPELLTVSPEECKGIQARALTQLLNLGTESSVIDRCPEQSILRHLGYHMPDQFSLPAASVRWLDDFGEVAPENCVCADPVHMLADTDHARLLDAGSLKLTLGESDRLLESLNNTFSEDGLGFVGANENHWYLTGKSAKTLKTLPVKTLVGRNVASFLPQGESTADWRRLSTEIQMLMFSHPLNQTRELRGQLTVNALWIWGAGSLPERRSSHSSLVYADEPFTRGLARQSGITPQALTEFFPDKRETDDKVLVDCRGMDALIHEDFDAWRKWTNDLESRVFAPALNALHSGRIGKLIINAGNGRQFDIVRSDWRRIFKRKRLLQDYVCADTVDPLST